MNQDPDLVLLLVAAPRPLLWLFAAFVCWRMRAVLPAVGLIAAVGCTMNAVNATFFALLNAHYYVNLELLKWVTGFATAGVALTVTGGCLMIKYLLDLQARLLAGGRPKDPS